MVFAIVEAKKLKPRRGGPPIKLLDAIIKDIKSKGMKLDTMEELQELRPKAQNDKIWEQL